MQKRSSTIPLLIYLLPMLGDMIVAQFLFVNAVRLARMGASASVVANVVTVWSVVYLVGCMLIGRFVNAANAARMMVGGMAGLALLSLLFLVVPGIAGIYGLMALAGVATVFFFVPFQIFMKAVDSGRNKSVAYSSGLYTFAWSLGFAIGPFVAGLLMELGTDRESGVDVGWKYAWVFSAVVSVAACGGIIFLKHLVQSPAEDDVIKEKPEAIPDYSTMPDLAWLGWIAGGTGVLVISVIRGVFPSRAESSLHLAQSLQGGIFFLLSLAQAVTGLMLCRSRFWMYKTLPVACFALAGILGTLALGFGHMPLVLCAGALLFGTYSGGFFFYIVFHALIHPERSGRYVAVNEAVVGLASVTGAAAGGWLADRFGFGVPYALGAVLICGPVLLAHHCLNLARFNGPPEL